MSSQRKCCSLICWNYLCDLDLHFWAPHNRCPLLKSNYYVLLAYPVKHFILFVSVLFLFHLLIIFFQQWRIHIWQLLHHFEPPWTTTFLTVFENKMLHSAAALTVILRKLFDFALVWLCSGYWHDISSCQTKPNFSPSLGHTNALFGISIPVLCLIRHCLVVFWHFLLQLFGHRGL